MRRKKFKHAKRPIWRIHWRRKESFYLPPNHYWFKTYREAFVEFMAWQEKRDKYQVALFRVQPLEIGEPGYCAHNQEHATFLMGDRYV